MNTRLDLEKKSNELYDQLDSEGKRELFVRLSSMADTAMLESLNRSILNLREAAADFFDRGVQS